VHSRDGGEAFWSSRADEGARFQMFGGTSARYRNSCAISRERCVRRARGRIGTGNDDSPRPDHTPVTPNSNASFP
jgi:hypothetical protein